MPDLVDLNTKQFYIYDSSKNIQLDTAITLSGVTNSAYTNEITLTNNGLSTDFNINGKITNETYSFISTLTPLTNKAVNYVKSGPFTVFDLNTELSDRMNEYMRALSEFQRCQRISQYINFGTSAGLTNTADNTYYFDSQGVSSKNLNFTNDTGACRLFGNTIDINTSPNQNSNSTQYSQLTNLNGNVFSTSGVNTIYTSSNISAFPSFNSAITGTQLSITGQYGVTGKEQPTTLGKNLAQMTGDITNLLQNYQKIVQYYTSTISSIPVDGSYNIANLNKTFQQNLNMRQELDQKLQAVLGAKNSYSYDSKMNVDASIYANIMLSILATTLIYFVLVKL
jgi:hypothetical protein